MWHNVQQARSEMRRCTTHALYRSKLWQQDHCQHPQNANPDGSTLEGTAQRIGRPFGGEAEGAIRWPVSDPGCGSRIRRRPTSPKWPRLGFRRSATTLYPSLTGPPPPPTWTHWTTSFGHTSRTSPTWPPTTPKPAWSLPSAEYSQSSCRCLNT